MATTARGEVVRLDADFNPDPTFGTDGVAALSWADFQYTAIVQPDGKILIGGGQRSPGDARTAQSPMARSTPRSATTAA